MNRQVFCPKCKNFLTTQETKGDELEQVCLDCGYSEKINATEPLEMYSDAKMDAKEFKTNTRIIGEMANDIIMPRIKMKCADPNCDADIMVFKRGIKNMSRMIICPECDGVWIEES